MQNDPITLLLVDDDEQIRKILSVVLAQVGYSVRTASNGFAALAELRKEIPDIILSDLNMPLMSGFELLSIVRQRFPLTRVVAMSGAFSGEAIPTGVSADAFYEKGSSPKSLLSWLDAVADPRTDTFTPTSASTQVLWIATVGHDTTGTAYVLLACPECLRAFPDVLTEAIETVRRTRCAHCLEAINYAIVRAEMPLLQTSLARGTESSRERASARH
jgi:CheY-like chemotaxis protein